MEKAMLLSCAILCFFGTLSLLAGSVVFARLCITENGAANVQELRYYLAISIVLLGMSSRTFFLGVQALRLLRDDD